MKISTVLLIVYLVSDNFSSIGFSMNRSITGDTLSIKSEFVFFASDDSVCSVSIMYPVINGMSSKTIEDKTNSFFKIEFLDLPEWLSIEDCDYETGFTYECNYKVRYNSTGFISVQQYVYEFSGGAHGNYAFYSYNLNLATGEAVTLTDVIKQEQLNSLSDAATSKILEDKNASSLAEAGLFEDTLLILPEQDFYITPGYLVLQFDPYEIGPYAMGEIEIKIPFHKLTGLLMPDLPFKVNE